MACAPPKPVIPVGSGTKVVLISALTLGGGAVMIFGILATATAWQDGPALEAGPALAAVGGLGLVLAAPMVPRYSERKRAQELSSGARCGCGRLRAQSEPFCIGCGTA